MAVRLKKSKMRSRRAQLNRPLKRSTSKTRRRRRPVGFDREFESLGDSMDQVDLITRGMYKIGLEYLLDLMSECLAVETGTLPLYTIARDRAQSPDIRAMLEKFLHQNESHVDILQTAIRDIGGNPVYVSPAAQVQQQRMRAMLDLHVPARYQQASDLESIVLAETKNQLDWKFLRSIIPFVTDLFSQEVLEKITDQPEDEVDHHLNWARQTLNRLMLQMVTRPADELSEIA